MPNIILIGNFVGAVNRQGAGAPVAAGSYYHANYYHSGYYAEGYYA